MSASLSTPLSIEVNSGDSRVNQHVTFHWNKTLALLTQRMGVHTDYLCSRFYTASVDHTVEPNKLIVVHFGDRGNNTPPGYAVHRLVHHDVHLLNHIEMCIAFTTTVHPDKPCVIKAGTSLDKILSDSRIQSCILFIPAHNQPALTAWDFL